MQGQFLVHPNIPQEIYLEVQKTKNKKNALVQAVSQIQSGVIVVCCFTYKTVQELTEKLEQDNIPCFYNDPSFANNKLKKLYDEVKALNKAVLFVLASSFNAMHFEVAMLIHYDMPTGLEEYCSQIAQIQNPTEEMKAILFYNSKDIINVRMYLKELSRNKKQTTEEVEQQNEQESEQIRSIIQYCNTEGCLREFIGQYFGDDEATRCNNCSSCEHNFEETDITDIARVIFTCIFRLGKPYNDKTLTDILRGVRSETVQARHFNHMPVFGMLNDYKDSGLQDIFAFLAEEGYLLRQEEPTAGLTLTEKANELLHADGKLIMHVKKEQAIFAKETKDQGKNPDTLALLNKLRSARSALAQGASVPAYSILSDSSLKEIAQKKPRVISDLTDITGFNEVKRKQYGDAFLEVVLAHMKNN